MADSTTSGLDARGAFVRAWGAVLLRSQQDDDYAARLRADPRGVLTEAGIPVRSDAEVTVEVVDLADGHLEQQIELYDAGESGGDYRFLVPSARVEIVELTEQELDGVAAGICIAAFVTPPVSGS